MTRKDEDLHQKVHKRINGSNGLSMDQIPTKKEREDRINDGYGDEKRPNESFTIHAREKMKSPQNSKKA